MLNQIKHRVLGLLLVVWVILWILFTARELFFKGAVSEYRALLFSSLEQKRAYVTGSRLYEFIIYANKVLPRGATYKLIGFEEGALEKRRATYYLYPHMERESADYLLVFDKKDINGEREYRAFSGLDDARYVLKKIGVK